MYLKKDNVGVNMRIGFLFDDFGISEVDMREPNKGNPGIGGTQYCFLTVAYNLKKMHKDMEIFFYHFNDNGNLYPMNFVNERLGDRHEIIAKCQIDEIDILLVNFKEIETIGEELESNNINTVVWAHNYLPSNILEMCNELNCIRRVVFVGRQQYDRYIDDKIAYKSLYIYNIVCPVNESDMRSEKYGKIVTYTGALVKDKGFHILAAQWKKILEQVPDAELYVIGTGKLYDRKAILGEFGIAESRYEAEFIDYLLDENRRILPSVHFMGIMGKEKLNIYKKTSVGIINPSARTETFGLSAAEMEVCGIPIVSKNANGFPDVILNKKTGFLRYTKYGFYKAIIKLLRNNKINDEFGNNAHEFVENEFNPERISKQWYEMFNDILCNKPAEYIKPSNNYLNNLKFIRIINREIKKYSMLSSIPSFVRVELFIRDKLLKAIRR